MRLWCNERAAIAFLDAVLLVARSGAGAA